MTAQWVVALVVLGLIAVQIALPVRRARRRARWRAQPLSPTQRQWVRATVPLAARMPAPFGPAYEGLINQFLHEKRFVGCNGLVVDERMRVIIAAQACLLLLRRADGCFDSLRTVLVYPDAFFVEHDEYDSAGLVHAGRDLRTGESWSDGQVIVSWADVLLGAEDPDDAYNVVIHEFAHQLDGQTGAVNGAPALLNTREQGQWPQRMRREYDALCAAVERGVHTFIDPYATTNAAEFFAVTSEVYFERPGELRARHPVLYDCLDAVYDVDPAHWR